MSVMIIRQVQMNEPSDKLHQTGSLQWSHFLVPLCGLPLGAIQQDQLWLNNSGKVANQAKNEWSSINKSMLLIVGIFEIAWNGDDVSPKSWSGMSQYHVYPRFFTGSSLLRSWCTDNIDVKLHGGNDFTEFPLSPMITTRFGHCVHLLEKGQYSWPVSSCKTSERSQKNLCKLCH